MLKLKKKSWLSEPLANSAIRLPNIIKGWEKFAYAEFEVFNCRLFELFCEIWTEHLTTSSPVINSTMDIRSWAWRTCYEALGWENIIKEINAVDAVIKSKVDEASILVTCLPVKLAFLQIWAALCRRTNGDTVCFSRRAHLEPSTAAYNDLSTGTFEDYQFYCVHRSILTWN